MKLPIPDPRARGYVIRRATLFDLRAVHRLEQAIFPRDAYPYFDLGLLFVLPRIRNLKVVAPDGSLAGFVSVGAALASPDTQWIITIGIDRAHQRRGLGEWLLGVAEQCFSRRPCTRLTVRESNLPAVRLYEKTGYIHVSRKPAYYLDGEAGLIMEKRRE